MSCDIIIPIWNQLEITRECLSSIILCTDFPYRLILIDNASEEPTRLYLKEFQCAHPKNVHLIRNEENKGFVRATNQGMRLSRAAFVCLLNNDTVVTKHWLSQMIDILRKNPLLGMINPQWQGDPGSNPQENALRLRPYRGQYHEVNECMGFCMVIRRELIEAIGILDEAFGVGGLDDSDYSRRAVLAGFRCARAKDTYVHHLENATFDLVDSWRDDRRNKTALYERKWGKQKQISLIYHTDAGTQDALLDELHQCLQLARLGLRVHVWIFDRTRGKMTDRRVLQRHGSPEHNNLLIVPFYSSSWPVVQWMKQGMFYLFCQGMLLSRRNKRADKKYQAVIVADRQLKAFLKKGSVLHGVPVFSTLQDCYVLTQELEWLSILSRHTLAEGRGLVGRTADFSVAPHMVYRW